MHQYVDQRCSYHLVNVRILGREVVYLRQMGNNQSLKNTEHQLFAGTKYLPNDKFSLIVIRFNTECMKFSQEVCLVYSWKKNRFSLSYIFLIFKIRSKDYSTKIVVKFETLTML